MRRMISGKQIESLDVLSNEKMVKNEGPLLYDNAPLGAHSPAQIYVPESMGFAIIDQSGEEAVYHYKEAEQRVPVLLIAPSTDFNYFDLQYLAPYMVYSIGKTLIDFLNAHKEAYVVPFVKLKENTENKLLNGYTGFKPFDIYLGGNRLVYSSDDEAWVLAEGATWVPLDGSSHIYLDLYSGGYTQYTEE